MDSARPFSAQDRRHLLRRAVLRPLLTAVLLVLAYFLVPLNGVQDVPTLTALIVGLVVMVALCVWQVRKVMRADFPGAQAMEALAVVVVVYLVGYATLYFLLSQADPGDFTEPLSRLDALYFCLTVFSTVGFGDISAKTEVARAVGSVQSVGNLVLIALGIRLLTAAVKWRRRRQTGPDAAPE